MVEHERTLLSWLLLIFGICWMLIGGIGNVEDVVSGMIWIQNHINELIARWIFITAGILLAVFSQPEPRAWAKRLWKWKQKALSGDDPYENHEQDNEPLVLRLHEGMVYQNEKVLLDWQRYIRCTFINVTFVFNGGTFHLIESKIDGSRFETSNPAVDRTFQMLEAMGCLKESGGIDEQKIEKPNPHDTDRNQEA